MTTESSIRVEGLSKRYRIGSRASYQSLAEMVGGVMRSPLKHLKKVAYNAGNHEIIWALKDVSFAVRPGEVIGIIGSNGAGKSTLLKILSRITEPTTGRVELYGRVGSLLEVGTGFHPELSGRENVYLNGAILGMRREEISRKFDQIVAFSEVAKFIDTPVKHYSTGMYMRLAFAVAAHLEPEVLIVDEVLAVGDASFQKKCLGKMGDVASEGRTVLFVSHNMAAVQSLCNRVIWLQQGQIADEGNTDKVVNHYLGQSSAATVESEWDDPAQAPGNEQVRLHRLRVRPVDGPKTSQITVQTPFVMEFEYWNLEPGAHLNLSLHLFNQRGTRVFNSFPVHEPVWHGRPLPAGLFRSSCYVPGDLLNDGVHRVLLLVVKDQAHVIFSLENALVFNVLDAVERRNDWHGEWEGAVRPDLEWKTEHLPNGLSGADNEIGQQESLSTK